ncbi:MAG: Nif3-like dinuclear metal center hexameric protein [DPANN group archaeon]|nr:Nif3-like dinuclear metal center hexameric protein [DPANN group archaeon]
MRRKALVEKLDALLKVKDIPDDSLNGLQVGGKEEVKKVAFAVDACMATIKKAAKEKCDMLIVHHGLFWKTLKPMTGIMGRRVKALFDNGISLYAAHLPLDMHPTLGNNAQLKLFGLKKKKPFAQYHGFPIGFCGEILPLALQDLVLKASNTLDSDVAVYDFGKEKVKTMGISSGGSAFALDEAMEKELDVLLIGEAGHSQYHYLVESGMNILVAGHYATETRGLKALQKHIQQKMKLKTTWIDMPTGL